MIKSNHALLTLYISISFFYFWSFLSAEPIITLFFHPYEQPIEKTTGQSQFTESLKRLGGLAQRQLSQLYKESLLSGILATYGGYLESSTNTGQLTFPRKHIAPSLTIIITPQIEPVMLINYVISHWELIPNNPAEAYLFEQKNDPQTGITFWNVCHKPLEGTQIPYDAIVILGKPQDFVIPEGISISSDSPNLMLPPIYVKEGVSYAIFKLPIINVSQYFRPADQLKRKKPDRTETIYQ